LKVLISEPRPAGSCSITCDIPSGHATISIGAATFCFLQVISRNQLRQYKTLISLVLLATLVPIPWSRVQLEDHSIRAVMLGSSLGVLVGATWFSVLHLVTPLLATVQLLSYGLVKDDYSIISE
jgi:membrane-associated phospholipid phosphatase